MITNDNYEGYLMRYADGELNAEECALVEAFLDAHPELRDELEAITDPSLKITPPLVSMPHKEQLVKPLATSNAHRPLWIGIAAAVALLLAFGLIVRIGHHETAPIVAHNNGSALCPDIDTSLPDSLFIGRGKPAPLLLAQKETPSNATLSNNQAIKQSSTPILALNEETGEADEPSEEDTLPAEVTPEPLLAQSDESPNKELVSRYNNVIVIETDQLVSITRKPTPNKDVKVGNVIENNQLALAEEKGLVGRAFDAITRFLLRRIDSENEQCLAFSE